MATRITGYITLEDWDTSTTERRGVVLDQGYTLNDDDLCRLRERIEKTEAEYLALVRSDKYYLTYMGYS